MKSKFLLSSLLMVAICQQAQAKVIELNALNSSICRQQIIEAGDYNPTILMYMKHCKYVAKIMPIFEQISNEMPGRAFFSFNFSEGDGSDYGRALTVHECLGFLPTSSPSLYMFSVMPAQPASATEPAMPGMIGGQMRMQLFRSENKAREEILKFVTVDDNA